MCATRSGGVVLVARVTDRIQERFLLSGRHDVNSVPSANLFTEQTSNAGLLIDLHLAKIHGRVFRRRRDAIERTNIHAHAASVPSVPTHHPCRTLSPFDYAT